ncbi:translation initiation factor eIF4e [Cutaneotrichosporon oleaginosum]|uniref:Translation initiation factor eIF4e n=1 Tax=Cutaneotrichosporon oleaginosum TaxID=879819 RepID=A0A0J0XYK3_9TREE|nr:translation initiation factor eIF4e [Cutaneotrichosporon oleaginosum]KLT46128.1 translation initiation factor eIF4e [Cutaneotrichosporon oleaginosum]TXT10139.1 hypothetical protein COLE_04073 [Cutaneotrichosporon oleaginosum]
MSQPAPRRTASLTGSSRLSLNVGTKQAPPAPGRVAGRHPLRQDWSISYVHRPPGAKVDYEKEIHKVATFGSIESFLHLYAHLTPPSDLPPVTDLLCFASRIQRPGIWEEIPRGGKFTIRLLHPITPVLYESLLFALIGDQFDESDNVVGCVLSVRQTEDILSVWVEEEGEAVRSGALREKIISLLSLPSTTLCEYRSNKALLDAASSMNKVEGGAQEGAHHGNAHTHHSHGFGGLHQQSQGFGQHRHQQHGMGQHHGPHGDRAYVREPRGPRDDASRTGGWGNGFRREQ